MAGLRPALTGRLTLLVAPVTTLAEAGVATTGGGTSSSSISRLADLLLPRDSRDSTLAEIELVATEEPAAFLLLANGVGVLERLRGEPMLFFGVGATDSSALRTGAKEAFIVSKFEVADKSGANVFALSSSLSCASIRRA